MSRVPVDPAIAAVLELMNDPDAPQIHQLGPAEARELFKSFAVGGDGAPTPVRSVTDRTIPGPAGEVPVRVVVPEVETPTGVLVWIHGGGFVIGDLDTSESTARRLAAGAGCVVVSVDYRLAPEHKAPAAFDDSWAATCWVAENRTQLGLAADAPMAVGGDSAGGNLSALVAVRSVEAGGPELALQLLVYPATDLATDYPSRSANGTGYFLSTDTMNWFGEQYLAVGTDPGDPSISPMFVAPATLAGVAPALVLVAGYDPLVDEGRAYADRLSEAGATVELLEFPSMIHGFFQMGAITPVALEAADEATAALRAAFSG